VLATLVWKKRRILAGGEDAMAKSKMHGIIERIGAESLASHLREQIQADQRRIAVHYSSVDGMSYPHNLLGEMEKLLAEHDCNAIKEKIKCWRQWIDDTEKVQQMMRRTLGDVEAFIRFYQEANGFDLMGSEE